MSNCKKCGLMERWVHVTDILNMRTREAIASNNGFPPADPELNARYLTCDLAIDDQIVTCPNWCFVAKGQFFEQGDKGYTPTEASG